MTRLCRQKTPRLLKHVKVAVVCRGEVNSRRVSQGYASKPDSVSPPLRPSSKCFHHWRRSPQAAGTSWCSSLSSTSSPSDQGQRVS